MADKDHPVRNLGQQQFLGQHLLEKFHLTAPHEVPEVDGVGPQLPDHLAQRGEIDVGLVVLTGDDALVLKAECHYRELVEALAATQLPQCGDVGQNVDQSRPGHAATATQHVQAEKDLQALRRPQVRPLDRLFVAEQKHRRVDDLAGLQAHIDAALLAGQLGLELPDPLARSPGAVPDNPHAAVLADAERDRAGKVEVPGDSLRDRLRRPQAVRDAPHLAGSAVDGLDLHENPEIHLAFPKLLDRQAEPVAGHEAELEIEGGPQRLGLAT